MANEEKLSLEAPQTTSRARLIEQIITSRDKSQVFVWIVDISDEPEVVGMPGYLNYLVPKCISDAAHAICCKDVYNGERKHRKAVRRLIQSLREYPNILDNAIEETFKLYE